MRDTIDMAREAGLYAHKEVQAELKAFEALVRADAIADERDKWMERTAILIRGEREACAKVCDDLADASNLVYAGTAAMHCADAIRARGNT
jgi:hypothetical protein